MRLNQLCRVLAMTVLGVFSLLAQTNLKLELRAPSISEATLTGRSWNEPQAERSKKSVPLAIAYSLILPGLGDLYADNFGTGKYFMGAEAGLWITYGGFRYYGQWLKDDAKTFAAQAALADFNGKDDKFEVNLGNFSDVASYNEAKLRNREFDLMYDPNSSYSWQWSSDADRSHYKDLRNRGVGTIQNSQFVVGALILNRVIAAISAARSALAYNRSVQTLGSWRVNARVPGGLFAANGLELTFSREF